MKEYITVDETIKMMNEYVKALINCCDMSMTIPEIKKRIIFELKNDIGFLCTINQEVLEYIKYKKNSLTVNK